MDGDRQPDPEPDDEFLVAFDERYAAELTDALNDDTEIEPSTAVQRFRRNTAAGAVLSGMALGLREVFDPVEREEAPIVQDAPGEPDVPRHVDAHLDPDDPTASSVTVRPWVAEAARQPADAATPDAAHDHAANDPEQEG